MSRFFSRDNWLWSPFSWVADMFILSCLWVICSVPLLTIGASTAALYDCVARCVRGGDEKMFARFFRTFRRELVQSVPSLLLWVCVIAGGYAAISAYGNNVTVTGTSTAITTGLLLLLTIVVGIAAWVFPLLSRFTMSFTSLNLMAARLALIHLPRTMFCRHFCACSSSPLCSSCPPSSHGAGHCCSKACSGRTRPPTKHKKIPPDSGLGEFFVFRISAGTQPRDS